MQSFNVGRVLHVVEGSSDWLMHCMHCALKYVLLLLTAANMDRLYALSALA